MRFAFGSSVPEIAAVDVLTAPIPRFSKKVEDELADLMESSAVARDQADELEQELATEAELLIDAFMEGDTERFVSDVVEPKLRLVGLPSGRAEGDLSYETVDAINAAHAPAGEVTVHSSL